MSLLIDQLAQVAGLRDLERLDQSLVDLIADTLRPETVAVWMTVHDHPTVRWTLRGRRRRNLPTLEFDSPSIELAQLPELASMPLLARCLAAKTPETEPRAALHALAVPLYDEDAGAAALELETPTPLGEADTRALASIVRFYANFRALVTDNERDLLTGLLNRKTFDEAFARASAPPATSVADPAQDRRERMLPGDSWLAVVDIDHFKRVNDQFGHLVGDEVLLLVARLMRASFRYTDRLFRFGGEEFVVLLRGTALEGARIALEKLRAQVSTFDFPRVGHISLSVGFTRIQDDDTPHAAFERADKAVYEAKQTGRNQCLFFEELVEAGRLPPPAAVDQIEFF